MPHQHPACAAWDRRIARVAPPLALLVALLVTLLTFGAYVH